jgi:hypothetical protein
MSMFSQLQYAERRKLAAERDVRLVSVRARMFSAQLMQQIECLYGGALCCPAHYILNADIDMMVPSPLTSDGGVVNTASNVTNADSVVGLGWTAMRLKALDRSGTCMP